MKAAVLLVAALLAAEDPAGPVDGVLRRVLERGPVKVTTELAPAPVGLLDLPILRIVVEHDPAVDVKLPAPAGEVGGLDIVDLRQPAPAMRDGREVSTLEIVLEPSASGAFTLPPFDLECVDRRAATLAEHPEGLSFTVSTDPLPLEVVPPAPAEAPTLDQLAPPLPPLEAEIARPSPWPWIAAAGGVLAAALAAFAFLRRTKRERVVAAPPPTPEELARREFVALVDADPLAHGDLAGFYSELTLIVRRYIERTTGVAAPEQTTEEFLREMRRHPSFDEAARERLRAFLESADLVKFAGVRPDRGDVEETFRRGQEFTRQGQPIALRAIAEILA